MGARKIPTAPQSGATAYLSWNAYTAPIKDYLVRNPCHGAGWVLADAADPVAGYRIYYGLASQWENQRVDVGNVLEYEMTGLVPGVPYYFFVTSYNTCGAETNGGDEMKYDPTTDTWSPTGVTNQDPYRHYPAITQSLTAGNDWRTCGFNLNWQPLSNPILTSYQIHVVNTYYAGAGLAAGRTFSQDAGLVSSYSFASAPVDIWPSNAVNAYVVGVDAQGWTSMEPEDFSQWITYSCPSSAATTSKASFQPPKPSH